MSEKKELTREPQIIAAVISVIGTITGTLLISVLLGVMEGRIGLGALVGVVAFLLVISILVLLGLKWGPRLAGAAAALMVILGSVVFLIGAAIRSIPSSTPGTTPMASAPSPTPKQGFTPSTSEPTSSPSPAQQCRIAFARDGDIYIKNCDGSGEYRLTDDPAEDANPAWSPDGQQIIFSSQRDRQPTPEGWIPASLYLVNADGSNLTRLTYEAEPAGATTNDTYSDWSPDGNQIAFHRNCNLAAVKNDGSDLRIIMSGGNDRCADNVLWSPDGQRIAFTSGWYQGQSGRHWTVYVINADGTGLLKLQAYDANYARPAWSPDGKQVGIEVTYYDGGTKYWLVNANGNGQPVEVPGISAQWYPDYWPRWGKEMKAAPSPSAAEEAKTFAEPILAGIAGRDPTWSDDFSDPTSGWQADSAEDGETGYENGEYFVVAHPNPGWPGDCCQCKVSMRPSSEFSDFVLEADLRVVYGATTGDVGHWDVVLRSVYQVHLSPDVIEVWRVPEHGTEVSLARYDDAPLKSPEEPNHLQIIAQGPKIALYLNGQPTGLIEDEYSAKGTIGFIVCTHTDVPLRVHFDNFKLWDISGLSP